MRPYRALFLDIDDTVLDYAQCGGQALAETCRRMGAVCTEEIAARFWAIDARVWAEQKRGAWTIDQVLDRRAKEMADLLGMPEKAGLFRYGFVDALGRTAVPVAGAAALLDRLRARGLPVYKKGLALAVAAQHHVIYNIHIAHQAHAQPVLRNKGEPNPQLANLHWRFVAQILGNAGGGVLVQNLPARKGLQAGNGLQQLALAAAGNTGNA